MGFMVVCGHEHMHNPDLSTSETTVCRRSVWEQTTLGNIYMTHAAFTADVLSIISESTEAWH